ncbi:DUF7666 domain-containing protein [Gallibacter intestinalis]|uniref:DUF7666 domain-containing protein n=1 Tax=Gallibacter intestinalis TaxID=2779356 RepID=A0ABR9QXV3_9FIRM|nr:hypothetical protein [Gallibacter intestinalis]MBE5035686.1 hypothetical protein [Gallibacter intestinalis]
MKIKGMDKNMQCRGFQFEVGKEYKKDNNGRPLELCSDTVFHYCNSLRDVNCFYDVAASDNRFFEIEVLGEEITDGTKCGSDHIKIIREITGEELNILKGLINGNTGVFNSGISNSGDSNSGYGNSGNSNSGNRNSGNSNSGDRNSGNSNSGNWNSGISNSGDRNSGNSNSGDWNSGNRNSGNMNSGDCNSGDWNSGDWNSGDSNSGDRNSGNSNSGYGNKCDGSNGVFCTEEDMDIRIFNKPSGMSLRDFYRSKYYNALCSAPFILTDWVEYTDEEKAEDEDKALIGGYLKTYTMEEAWANWWEEMTQGNKEIIKSIPNFDAEIFKKITGIEVKQEDTDE